MPIQRQSYLLRHVLVSTLVLWAVLALGILAATPIVLHLGFFKPDLNGHYVRAVAEILETARGSRSPEDIVQGMPEDANSSGELFIADESGKIIAASNGAGTITQIDPAKVPEAPLEVAPIGLEMPSPGSPAVVRLRSSPARFLIFKPRVRAGPEQFMLLSILGLITFLVMGAMGTSSYVLLRKLREHALAAEDIMNRIEAGELGARLKVVRQDEFGAMMNQFNRMAGEVENLFVRVRETERNRLNLLQEIGHDLRTPMSSLLNIFEIVIDKFDKLPEDEKLEFMATGLREVKFTQQLVEDLLFLARVQDPFAAKSEFPVNFSQLILEEIENKRTVNNLEIFADVPPAMYVVAEAQLLRRLIRNALDNSISFSHKQLQFRVAHADGQLQIVIDDDGPGFSAETLSTFGKRRPVRTIHSEGEGRVSLGLGSVIMTAIALRYAGHVEASNRIAGNKVEGARVSISLKMPLVAAPSIRAAS